MNKHVVFFLLFFSFSGNIQAQKVKMGEFTSEEIALTEVSFEPDAPAVVHWEEGDSKFLSGLIETSYLFRKKILKESGKSEADVRISYYVGESRTEEISGIKAQITNFENGEPSTFKLEKENFYDVDLGNGWKEVRISFPNAQVGSIIEYSFRKTDKNLTFLDGWTFQNPIPTLGSQYQIILIPQLQYKMIGQGSKYLATTEKEEANGVYRWTLRNLYSMKEEPFMKNYGDYKERVEFQLSRYQRAATTAGPEWEDVIGTWEKLGDEIVGEYQEKGYYRTNPIEKEMLNIDLSGATQKEQAEKAYYFIREHFTISNANDFWPNQTLSQFLKSKSGSVVELNLALMGILKSVGIACDPVLIGSKGNGRSELVSFPFLNQFDGILLMATIDGKTQMLDLEDPLAPFGYVGVQKHVKAGLLLEEEKSSLIPVEIKHASNTIFFTEVSLNESKDLVMKSTLRTYFYEGLDIAQKVQFLNEQNEPLEKLFTNPDELKISGVEVVDELQQKNFISTKFDLILEGAGNEDLFLFNPLKFSNFSKNPFTQEYRVFPVDFEYPFTETYNANIKIPEGYELDDYPLETRITIEGNALSFSYTPQIIGDMLKVTAKFEVKIPIIEAQKYGDLKFFMESVASKLSEPVIFKKLEIK
jgi:hypothetical protein